MATPVGAKSFGPSGWVAVGGMILNGIIYGIQQSINVFPPDWTPIILSVISVLTVLGIYRAPNHVDGSITPAVVLAPDAPPPPPAPAPVSKPTQTHLP